MKSTTPLREITAAARTGLTGSWGKSMGIVIIYMLLITGVSSNVPLVSTLLMLIFAAPLVVGLHIYFLASVNRKPNPFRLLFDGFGRFGTSWCAYMLVLLIIFAWMIPFGLIAPALFFFVHPDPAIFPAYTMTALFAVVGLLASCFMIGLQMRYYFVLYIVADDNTIRAREAVQRSAELMKGNYWRLVLLWLRFTGWQILAMLTLGIGFLWMIPYLSAATAAFYLDVKNNS